MSKSPSDQSPTTTSESSISTSSTQSKTSTESHTTSETTSPTSTRTSSTQKATSTSEHETTTSSSTTSKTSSTPTETSTRTHTSTSASSSTTTSTTASTTGTESTSTTQFATTSSSTSLSSTTSVSVPPPFQSLTQSPTQSASGFGSFTSYYASTDSNGFTHTISQIIAAPSSTSTPGGFVHNTGAVAAVSVVIGVLGAAVIACAFFYFRRRRQAAVRDDELADFSEMSYAAGGGSAGGYYSSSGARGSHTHGSESRDHIPMQRSPSVGSLHQPPLAPVDMTRMSFHPYSSRSSQSHTGDLLNDEFSNNTNEYNASYSSHAQDVVGQAPNHAGYGAAASRAQPRQGENQWGVPVQGRNQYDSQRQLDQQPQPQQQQQQQRVSVGSGALLNGDPFANPPDDNEDEGGYTLSYYAITSDQTMSPPRRSMSTKSRGMTFGHPEEDERYFDEHGPTNDDDSIVLGRPSLGNGIDSRLDESIFRPNRSTFGRSGPVDSDVSLQDNRDYSRKFVVQ